MIFLTIIRCMSTKSTVPLAFFAGLFGSMLSLQLVPTRVFAQQPPTRVQSPPISPAPIEVRAQRFTLVDPAGIPVGTFHVSGIQNGERTVALTDERGREVWRGPPAGFRPLAGRRGPRAP